MIRRIYPALKLELQVVLKICKESRIFVYNPEDNYLPMTNICVYCKHEIYIGRELTNIPREIRTYSVTPQDFELYEKNVKEYVRRH